MSQINTLHSSKMYIAAICENGNIKHKTRDDERPSGAILAVSTSVVCFLHTVFYVKDTALLSMSKCSYWVLTRRHQAVFEKMVWVLFLPGDLS